MKLLFIVVLCIQMTCVKSGDFIVGGADARDDDITKAMAYIQLGPSEFCTGVCISERVVLTCGRCNTAVTATVKVMVGLSKATEDGGGVEEIRQTKDGEIGMIITKDDMTTCKPLKMACTRKHVPKAGESTTMYGWGMTAVTPEQKHPDKVQIVDMKWATNDAGCTSTYTGGNKITTGGKKYICMEPNKNPHPTATACFGDCGGPAIKEGRLVGIIIRSPGSCAPGTPTVVASIFPRLYEVLGVAGAGGSMLDFANKRDITRTAKKLPVAFKKQGCTPMYVRMTPDSRRPGDCKDDETKKDYGETKKGADCGKMQQQIPGYVVTKKKFKCSAKALKEANGCKCCTKGTVEFRCYKCSD